MKSLHTTQRGFTLIEMIVVIVITGILAGMVAVFLRWPVQGYVDSSNRARMSDIADTALRRIGRDIRTAVPNSVRVPVNTLIQFIPTSAGGRYRAVPASAGSVVCGSYAGAVLSFGVADTCFEIIGPPVNFTAGDQIVVGSTQSSGNPPYDNTVNGVRRGYTGAAGAQTVVNMAGAAALPIWAEVEGQRFDVVPAAQQAVTYACLNPGAGANGNGSGTLTRFWAYGYAGNGLASPNNAILADNVSACEITYNTTNQRNGLVAIRLAITRNNETISLYHEIHVNNVP